MEQFIEEYGICLLLLVVGGSALAVFGLLMMYL
jgi:hypothetical protein